MANYGLTIQQVNDIVSTAFAGKAAGVIYENERQFELVVRLDSVHRSSIEALIGRDFDLQELHLNLISLSGNIDETDDEFTLAWAN